MPYIGHFVRYIRDIELFKANARKRALDGIVQN
jgi:hypothetical protein